MITAKKLLDKHWNDGNSALLCTYPNILKCYEEVWKTAQEKSWRDNAESLKCIFNLLRPICSRDEKDTVLKSRVYETMEFCQKEIDWIEKEYPSK